MRISIFRHSAILYRSHRIPPSITFPSFCCFYKTVSRKFKHGDSIKLNVIVPPFGETQVVKCKTTKELHEFVGVYKGVLKSLNPPEVILPGDYTDISPSAIYEIISPFFSSMEEERQHRQTSDKAFEEKSRAAMIRYLNDHKLSFHDLGREIKVSGKIVAEWEGVFELEDGQLWFLESKHCVTTVCCAVAFHPT